MLRKGAFFSVYYESKPTNYFWRRWRGDFLLAKKESPMLKQITY
jgi:hypothetical protein